MKLPVRESGRGECLLMVHGIMSDSSFFLGMEKYLSASLRTVSVDRRGYGDCPPPEDGDYTVRAQAQDLFETIQECCGEPCWIFGNSAGALPSIELAMQHPELVKGLILLEPSFLLDEESEKELGEWNRALNGFVAEKKLKKALPAFAEVIAVRPLAEAGEDTPLEIIKPAAKPEKMDMAEMKRTYRNLQNFMLGELNEVQHYRPGAEAMKKIHVPVRVLITKEGRGTIFAKSSVRGAKVLGWKTVHVPGRHNAAKEEAMALAKQVQRIMEEMRMGEA